MTEINLKEYLESKLAALQAEVNKSEALLNRRLETMNEFRNALKDQSATMATREQVEMHTRLAEEKIDKLEIRLRNLENAKSYTIGWAAALAFIISVIGVIIRLAS